MFDTTTTLGSRPCRRVLARRCLASSWLLIAVGLAGCEPSLDLSGMFESKPGDIPRVNNCRAASASQGEVNCPALSIGTGLNLELVGEQVCNRSMFCYDVSMEIAARDRAGNLAITPGAVAGRLQVRATRAGRGELVVEGDDVTFLIPYEVKPIHHSEIALRDLLTKYVAVPRQLHVLEHSKLELVQLHYADAAGTQPLTGRAPWRVTSTTIKPLDVSKAVVEVAVNRGDRAEVRVGSAMLSLRAREQGAIHSFELVALSTNSKAKTSLYALVVRDRNGDTVWGLGAAPDPYVQGASLLPRGLSSGRWLLLRDGGSGGEVTIHWAGVDQSVPIPD